MELNTYLMFGGNCREAFEAYEQALGARIVAISTYGESPGGENTPAQDRDKIMHVRLQGDGWVLMGSDDCKGPYKGIEGCSQAVNVASVAEAERVFAALADGGTVTMPLDKTFWAERFGMLKDRFGVGWMVNFDLPQA
jgi:PhnB protein